MNDDVELNIAMEIICLSVHWLVVCENAQEHNRKKSIKGQNFIMQIAS